MLIIFLGRHSITEFPEHPANTMLWIKISFFFPPPHKCYVVLCWKGYNRNMFYWCWNYISQTDYIKSYAGEELYKCNMIKVMINKNQNLRECTQYLCTSIKQDAYKRNKNILFFPAPFLVFLNAWNHLLVLRTVLEVCAWILGSRNTAFTISFSNTLWKRQILLFPLITGIKYVISSWNLDLDHPEV